MIVRATLNDSERLWMTMSGYFSFEDKMLSDLHFIGNSHDFFSKVRSAEL